MDTNYELEARGQCIMVTRESLSVGSSKPSVIID